MNQQQQNNSDRLRQLRHDLLNTIAVIKLELRVAKNASDGEAKDTIESIESEVRKLQDQLTELFEYKSE